VPAEGLEREAVLSARRAEHEAKKREQSAAFFSVGEPTQQKPTVGGFCVVGQVPPPADFINDFNYLACFPWGREVA